MPLRKRSDGRRFWRALQAALTRPGSVTIMWHCKRKGQISKGWRPGRESDAYIHEDAWNCLVHRTQRRSACRCMLVSQSELFSKIRRRRGPTKDEIWDKVAVHDVCERRRITSSARSCLNTSRWVQSTVLRTHVKPVSTCVHHALAFLVEVAHVGSQHRGCHDYFWHAVLCRASRRLECQRDRVMMMRLEIRVYTADGRLARP